MTKFFILLSSLFITSWLLAQDASVVGIVQDASTQESLIGASVYVADGSVGALTDIDGRYRLSLPAGKYRLLLSYIGYAPMEQSIDLVAGEQKTVNWQLGQSATLLDIATVSSGRFEKALGEVTVSLEVIRPTLIENSNQPSLDRVLEKVPGVSIVDGQPNIRGGSGYSYGAGSRVLLLVDDIPILQSDAGFPNWNDVPIENIEQVEILKGAASALYGSSAMNGIINVRTGFARNQPETAFSSSTRLYAAPEQQNAAWWKAADIVPYESASSLRHARKIGKLDMVLSGFYYNQRSFERDNFSKYGRFTSSWRYRATDRLSFQLNTNFNTGSNQSYFFWAGIDSLLLTAARNTASIGRPTRFNLDPSVTYYSKSGDRHKLLGRFYSVDNNNNENRSNSSDLYYGEYQYQKRFSATDFVLTGGLVAQGTAVQAELYGDTTYRSRNYATYLQLERKFFNKLNLSLGGRYEYNALFSPTLVAGVEIPEGKTTESRPVFRLGLNYQAASSTYLRASWGQGYRYPTIAEKFIRTQFGGVLISPNPLLGSETGWTSEIGVKQGFRKGELNGFVDVTAFWSEYQNMLEFSFENLFVTGFQSLNVGDTRIRGLELSIGGQGQLLGGNSSFIGGYTFIDPVFKEWAEDFPSNQTPTTQAERNAALSTSDKNILKYRNRHSAKLDIENQWGNFSLGIAGIYNSRVENIDWIFEALVVPQLAEWRANETGYLTASVRTAYRFSDHLKVSFLIDNVNNALYTQRPGLLAAPRSFALRFDLKW